MPEKDNDDDSSRNNEGKEKSLEELYEDLRIKIKHLFGNEDVLLPYIASVYQKSTLHDDLEKQINCLIWGSKCLGIDYVSRKNYCLKAVQLAKKHNDSSLIGDALYNLASDNEEFFKDPEINSKKIIEEAIKALSSGEYDDLLKMIDAQILLKDLGDDFFADYVKKDD